MYLDQYHKSLVNMNFSWETDVTYYSTLKNDPRKFNTTGPELQRLVSRMDLGERTRSQDPQSQEGGLQILAIPGGGWHPIKLPRPIFLDMLQTCHFPSIFISSMFAHCGRFAHFIEYSGETPTHLSVIIKYPESPIVYQAVVLRCRLSDRSASCVILDDAESNIGPLTRTLKRCREALNSSPLHVINILADRYGRRAETWRQSLDDKLVLMEKYTDFDKDPLKYPEQGFEERISGLQSLHAHLIWLDGATNFELELSKFGVQMVELCDELRQTRGQEKLGAAARASLKQESDLHINDCELRRYQGKGLQQRAQAQMNLLYSEISQRDSRINLSLAQDSRQIASAALKDSRAMRTIAVLTMLFLPVNLVAAVYSSGIINVRPKIWWTFVVSASSLTLLVFAFWSLYTKWERRRLRVNTGAADADNGD